MRNVRASRIRIVVRVVEGCDELGDFWYPVKHWHLSKMNRSCYAETAAKAMAYSIENGIGFPGGGPYIIDVVFIDVDAPGGAHTHEPERFVVESKLEVTYEVTEI